MTKLNKSTIRQDEFYKVLKKRLVLKKRKSFKRQRKYLRIRLKKRKDLKTILRKNRESKRGGSGVIHLLCNKRNIFCTLSDSTGQIKASVSTGMLKVKGRKRRGFHYVPKTGQLLINHLFKIKYRSFLMRIKGNGPKKKKRVLLNCFLKIKKFQYPQLTNLVPRSHNGCRPPKIRRK